MQRTSNIEIPSDQPLTFNGDLAALPAALRPLTEHRRWIVWRWVQKEPGTKWTKPPYRADDPSAFAQSNEPSTWSTYAAAVAAVKAGRADGIGYVLTHADGLPNGVGAIDLDDCRDPDTSQLTPWAQQLIDEASYTYVEATVSGTGLRIVGLVEGTHLHTSVATPDGGGIEFFRHATRFITISGLEIGNCGELRNIDELVDRTYEKFAGEAVPRRSRVKPQSSGKRKVALKPIPDSLAKLVAENPVHQPEVAAEADAWLGLLKRAYDLIPNDDLPRKAWDEKTATLYNATCGTDAGLKIALDFAKKSKKHHNESTVIDRWRHWDRSPYTALHAESIFYWAWEAAGDFWWRDDEGQTDEPSTDDKAEADADPQPEAKAEEPPTSDWPTMDEAAYHGIVGEAVRTIEPHSEADPVAILIQLIVAVGNIIGRQAYYQVESDRHYPNLFAAAVGDTSKARKGTSWGRVKDVCYHADSDWVLRHIGSGLSSGEGLIHQVRDPVIKIKDSKEEVVDAGVTDKRFMALEAELSGLLKVMERPGNTISPLFRKAWDGGDLQTLTRSSALKATKVHVSSIGHITIEELRARLTQTDAANGFANRFLFFLVRRSKELPMGGSLDDEVIRALGGKIGSAINFRMVGEDGFRVRFSPEGEARWREVYGRLTKGHPGLFGAITARGEAQVIRIALVYVVLDKSEHIDLPHVEAGLAVWDYCEQSAKRIFGEMLGDPVADTILGGLKRVHPDGLTRAEIYRDLFGSNARASTIAAALARLKDLGLAKVDVIKAAGVFGKPTEVWTYTPST